MSPLSEYKTRNVGTELKKEIFDHLSERSSRFPRDSSVPRPDITNVSLRGATAPNLLPRLQKLVPDRQRWPNTFQHDSQGHVISRLNRPHGLDLERYAPNSRDLSSGSYRPNIDLSFRWPFKSPYQDGFHFPVYGKDVTATFNSCRTPSPRVRRNRSPRRVRSDRRICPGSSGEP